MNATAESPTSAAHLEFKAALLLVLTLLLIGGAVLYLMYARGVFEKTQQLVLLADNSEGVVVGMDLTFSGFPVGRVRRIELGQDGNARIIVYIPLKDARWLRESSVFTLVRGMLGNTQLRAYSGILSDPPLPDGAVRTALQGDATEEIPRLVAAARDVVNNLNVLTAPGSSLSESVGNVKAVTEKLNGPSGALGVLLGNEADAQKAIAALDRTNALLARIDGLAVKAEAQIFGSDGVMHETRDAIVLLKAILSDARASLKKVDA
ncbi:MAG: MlaD family protein, partial [Burkholderiaceae bacterium]|nr:MlaD family protein [Burkholderiaceae bacterium]